MTTNRCGSGVFCLQLALNGSQNNLPEGGFALNSSNFSFFVKLFGNVDRRFYGVIIQKDGFPSIRLPFLDDKPGAKFEVGLFVKIGGRRQNLTGNRKGGVRK